MVSAICGTASRASAPIGFGLLSAGWLSKGAKRQILTTTIYPSGENQMEESAGFRVNSKACAEARVLSVRFYPLVLYVPVGGVGVPSMTCSPVPVDHGNVRPGRNPDFPAKRYNVPLAIHAPQVVVGFSACKIAPGLEIRETTQADIDRLHELNKTWASNLAMMHTVPLAQSSHMIWIDEQAYGHYIDQKILLSTGKTTDPAFKRLLVDDIYKMLVVALHLFRLVPLYVTKYFMVEEYDKEFFHLDFFRRDMQVNFDTWYRYSYPVFDYNMTKGGKINCDEIIQAANVLETYFRYNHWTGNRIAIALHNFWNALFVRDSTLAFVALVTVIETFTNLSKDEDTAEQVYRNTLKLVPVDGHGNAVTRDRLEEMYDTRSIIAHGSYGRDQKGPLGWDVTHLDAKFANVDVRLSTSVMSIAARLLHRVLFDPTIVSLLENAKTSKQERRRLREHLNAMPSHVVTVAGPSN
jgi:hypothetical protein